MYKLSNPRPDGTPRPGIIRLVDNAYIPEDALNTDWQAYQCWLAQGNTPLPADK